MKKFRIKTEKSQKEKEFFNLKDDIIVKETINVGITILENPDNNVDQKMGETTINHIWYIDVNDVPYPQRFLEMHYDEVDK